MAGRVGRRVGRRCSRSLRAVRRRGAAIADEASARPMPMPGVGLRHTDATAKRGATSA